MVTQMLRDPQRTRAAILKAALTEFARVGPAGARVDRIAAEAGVNKRMLYHYFGSKDGLYRTLLAEQQRQAMEASAHVSGERGHAHSERLAALDAAFAASPDWVRLLMWGELDGTLRSDAQTRRTRPDADAAQLDLALQAIAILPWAFPALAQAITGIDPSDHEFTARRQAFFQAFGRSIGAQPKPRVRLTPDVVGR